MTIDQFHILNSAKPVRGSGELLQSSGVYSPQLRAEIFSRFSLNLYSLYLSLNLSETQYSLYCKDAIVSPLSVLPAFCTCVHMCAKELQVKWISSIIADYVACTTNVQKY